VLCYSAISCVRVLESVVSMVMSFFYACCRQSLPQRDFDFLVVKDCDAQALRSTLSSDESLSNLAPRPKTCAVEV
jgi:hypothetical protein